MGIENIDVELAKIGLKRVVKLFYNVGHYSFNAIAYLLKCIETSNSILYIYIETPEAIECHKR